MVALQSRSLPPLGTSVSPLLCCPPITHHMCLRHTRPVRWSVVPTAVRHRKSRTYSAWQRLQYSRVALPRSSVRAADGMPARRRVPSMVHATTWWTKPSRRHATRPMCVGMGHINSLAAPGTSPSLARRGLALRSASRVPSSAPATTTQWSASCSHAAIRRACSSKSVQPPAAKGLGAAGPAASWGVSAVAELIAAPPLGKG